MQKQICFVSYVELLNNKYEKNLSKISPKFQFIMITLPVALWVNSFQSVAAGWRQRTPWFRM